MFLCFTQKCWSSNFIELFHTLDSKPGLAKMPTLHGDWYGTIRVLRTYLRFLVIGCFFEWNPAFMVFFFVCQPCNRRPQLWCEILQVEIYARTFIIFRSTNQTPRHPSDPEKIQRVSLVNGPTTFRPLFKLWNCFSVEFTENTILFITFFFLFQFFADMT